MIARPVRDPAPGDQPVPLTNSRVELVLDDGRYVTSRVEEVDDTGVTVSAAGIDPSLRVRDAELCWMTARGPATRPVSLEGVSTGEVPRWRLRFVGEFEVSQRRAYVRVEVSDPVYVRAARSAWTGSVLDVSEGGARLLAPVRPLIATGEELDVLLEVEGSWIAARGRVLRLIQARGGGDALAVQFTELEPRQSHQIRRALFAIQRRQRRMIGGEG